jgi:hypothetical protein
VATVYSVFLSFRRIDASREPGNASDFVRGGDQDWHGGGKRKEELHDVI